MPHLQIIAEDRERDRLIDLTGLTCRVQWTDTVAYRPGCLMLELIDPTIRLSHGGRIQLYSDGVGLFSGFIMYISCGSDGRMTVYAYDQRRYLNNMDMRSFSYASSSEIFTKICEDLQLPYQVRDPSTYKLGTILGDRRSNFSILEEALEETALQSGQKFLLRDCFGKLEHVHTDSLQSNLLLGDNDLLTEYQYTSDIRQNTYNAILLVQNNDQKQTRYLAENPQKIAAWGRLQYIESADGTLNQAQVQERAERLLQEKCREKKSLRLQALGDLRIYAGCSFYLSAEALVKQGIAAGSRVMALSCTHDFWPDSHMMSIEAEITQTE